MKALDTEVIPNVVAYLKCKTVLLKKAAAVSLC